MGSQLTGRTILVVDDNPENLIVLGELLLAQHKVRTANSGERALHLARQAPLPDLVLLDVMMPGMSGYEVLEGLRADPLTRDIPVIFVTAMSGVEDEQHGLELGAVDYVTKPLHPAIVLARVNTHLELKSARDHLQHQNARLEVEIARRMHENQVVQDVTIHALARLAEMRDEETGNHIVRTQDYVEQLAKLARAHPRFAAALNERTVVLISKSAPLHDIGKVGIPDHILHKPGKLNADEWGEMQTHAKRGADAIRKAISDTTEAAEFLDYAIDIAQSHHERWDGSGYPDHLAGEAIPLAARLMAIADVFDALISRRVYKAPFTPDEAYRLMAEQRGRHFDPDLLDIFLGAFGEFCAIASRYPDTPAPPGSSPPH
ncbi:Response regulator receiver modulated metal dependent phosphohydrolase [Rubrivivax sp. A210]|uniref:response regulator n=1 Tax=Rubrivivax sp. A210 TaxID=2772301 RepID=UPI0019892319|nr:two-component system response regulator [Rubrivivax sp. A210]CAD5373244.1 Response regulator receiver modulated metal dependent phosphohydrolase [Rubrivivax sp. A210]